MQLSMTSVWGQISNQLYKYIIVNNIGSIYRLRIDKWYALLVPPFLNFHLHLHL